MSSVTVNGKIYSDDGSSPNDMGHGGHLVNLLPMLGDTIIDTAGKVSDCATQAGIAAAQAAVAVGAAASTVTGPGSTGTSTTSLTVGLGTKSLTIQTGKTLYLGMPIVIAATATPLDVMYGSLVSYNSGTGALVVDVTNIKTTAPGTYITAAAWTVSLSGPAGVTGLLNEFKAAPVASASTVNLDAVTGNLVHIAGSATINAITLAQGAERTLVLDGAPLFTNSANLILPAAENLQGTAGSTITVRGEGGSVVRVTGYLRADGVAKSGTNLLAAITLTAVSSLVDLLSVFSAKYDNYRICINGVHPSGTADSMQMKFANAGAVDNTANFAVGGPGAGPMAVSTDLYPLSSIVSGGSGPRGACVIIDVSNVNDTVTNKMVCSSAMASTNGVGFSSYATIGTYTGGPVSGFRLQWAAGANFAANGTICVYGLQKS